MKHLKTAGLCLMAMLTLSMAAAATATAAPVWETCETEKAAAAATKYTENTCITTSGSGKWAWQAVPASAPASIRLGPNTLTLRDTKTIGGEAEIRCTIEGGGKAGGSVAKIESLTFKSCATVKGPCEKIEEVKALDLPWQTEFFETEKKISQTLKGAGAGEPAWSVKCKTILGTKTDECKREPEDDIHLEDFLVLQSNEWLVLETFEEFKHWTCSEGGKEAGRVEGSEAWLWFRAVRVR